MEKVDDAVKNVKLAFEEWMMLVDEVECCALERKGLVDSFSMHDFFAGAMTVMFALGINPAEHWIYGFLLKKSLEEIVSTGRETIVEIAAHLSNNE